MSPIPRTLPEVSVSASSATSFGAWRMGCRHERSASITDRVLSSLCPWEEEWSKEGRREFDRTRADRVSAGQQSMIGLIEDDPIMGESLMQRLELEGYRVSVVADGGGGARQLPKAACQVLLCDIRLPDIDGEQLFRRILPDLGATPVIFLTAFGEVEQAVRLMRAGADDYITKPFEVDTVLQRIDVLCAREMTAGNDIARTGGARMFRGNAWPLNSSFSA